MASIHNTTNLHAILVVLVLCYAPCADLGTTRTRALEGFKSIMFSHFKKGGRAKCLPMWATLSIWGLGRLMALHFLISSSWREEIKSQIGEVVMHISIVRTRTYVYVCTNIHCSHSSQGLDTKDAGKLENQITGPIASQRHGAFRALLLIKPDETPRQMRGWTREHRY